MSIQEAALYGDLVLALRDYTAEQLASHAADLTAEEAHRQVDGFIRGWFFAPQEELYGSAPRDVIWREQLGEPNPLPRRYAAEVFDDDCPFCQMLRAEIENAESDEVHGHHWTYCPDSCLLAQYDPEGSEERWKKEEARLERRENPSTGADYLARGISCGERGDYDRALEDMQQAVRLEPTCAEAYYWRGLTYAFKQEYAQAVQDFDRAAELQPHSARTYLNRGLSYFHQQAYDRAIPDLDRALALDPACVEGYYFRGRAHYYLDDYAQAIADQSVVIRLDPDCVEAYSCRGNAYLESEDYERALSDYDTALRLDRSRFQTWFNRARAHEQQGRPALAIADYEQCLRLAEDSSERQRVEERLHMLRK